MKKVITMYTDGGARGNPGPAGIGVVLYNDRKEIVDTIAKYLGEKTNNEAEYTALLEGVHRARALGAQVVHCFADSELMVKQLLGDYRVRSPSLARLFTRCWNALVAFDSWSIAHVPRAKNKAADRLVNQAIDSALYEKS